VNLAARLEAAAPVGGIFVSDATRAAAPGIRTAAAGRLDVKGRAEPVAAHSIVVDDAVIDLSDHATTPTGGSNRR
jgi:class 3 adenylate cyclase